MHTTDPYSLALSAAEHALAGMALRAMLANSRASEPEVVSLRLTVAPDSLPGLCVIEVEAIDRNGHAVGGWSL